MVRTSVSLLCTCLKELLENRTTSCDNILLPYVGAALCRPNVTKKRPGEVLTGNLSEAQCDQTMSQRHVQTPEACVTATLFGLVPVCDPFTGKTSMDNLSQPSNTLCIHDKQECSNGFNSFPPPLFVDSGGTYTYSEGQLESEGIL